VRERILEMIQRKVDGQDITTDVTPESGGKIIDLMEALKASLARDGSSDGAAERLVS
jgi:non-homologous end joining protein Ku